MLWKFRQVLPRLRQTLRRIGLDGRCLVGAGDVVELDQVLRLAPTVGVTPPRGGRGGSFGYCYGFGYGYGVRKPPRGGFRKAFGGLWESLSEGFLEGFAEGFGFLVLQFGECLTASFDQAPALLTLGDQLERS